jgi:polyketide biosynthesis acyl carrier protein
VTKDQIFEVIKKNVLYVLPDLPAEAIRVEESLKDLGANSVDRMDIVMESMEALQLKIPLTHLAQVKNIQGLVDLFYEACHVRV